MRVLIEGGIGVWIFKTDAKKQVRCFIEGFEVRVNLDAPFRPIFSETESDFLDGKVLRVVQRNLSLLLAKWNELNP